MIHPIRNYKRVFSVLFIYIMFGSELASFSYGMKAIEKSANKIGFLTDEYMYGSSFFLSSNSSNEVQNNARLKPESELVESKLRNVVSTNSTSAGPGQSENSGFTVSSTDGMVNKFTGDFSYSIPLMDVEGYPINISYNSNVNMHTKASWVGLGWDLNIGAVNREMRGVPDEFNGEQKLERVYKQRDQITKGKGSKTFDGKTYNLGKKGVYIGASYELPIGDESKWVFVPSSQVTFLRGKYWDSYLGLGKTVDLSLQGQFTFMSNESGNNRVGLGPDFQLGYSRDTKRGVGINKGLSISGILDNKNVKANGSLAFSSNFHTRYGLTERTFGMSASGSVNKAVKSEDKSQTRAILGFSTGLSLYGITAPYGTVTSIPKLNFNSASRTTSRTLDSYGGIQSGPLSARIGTLKIKSYNETKILLDDNKLNQPVYGYLHSSKRGNHSDPKEFPVMDFERGADHEYSEEMKQLPFSIQTFDFFHVSAAGFSASFRPQRRDFGTYYDATTKGQINEIDLSSLDLSDESIPLALKNKIEELLAGTISTSKVSIGAILNEGNLDLQASVSLGNISGGSESGVWKEPLKFVDQSNGDDFDGTIFFKSVGEPTSNIMNGWNGHGGNAVTSLGLAPTSVGEAPNLGSSYNTINPKNSVTAGIFLPKITSEFSSDPYFDVFDLQGNIVPVDRFVVGEPNHISAVESIAPNGTRYKYDIPVYNLTQSEVSFSTGMKDDETVSLSNSEGLVSYSPGQDNSVNNDRGRAQVFEKSKVPSYAHSYLLTEIIGSDYTDRQGDGPSRDDIGNYYKFDYTRVHNDANPYQWRYPISGGFSGGTAKALHNEGLIGTTLDNVANYSFGTKEIYYVKRIQSKNMIACFYISPRKDGYGANENGFLVSSSNQMQLDSIKLYNLNEFNLAELNGTEKFALQTVVFEYGNDLCKSYANNINTYNGNVSASGKSTLLSISVRNGDSYEMSRSKYVFQYSGENPNYNLFNSDSWGNYKLNDTIRPNDFFPYTDQEKTAADQRSKAWKLVSITNPSGGQLDIEYEADAYRFVQEKRAMRQFKVAGMLDMLDFLWGKDQTSWEANMGNGLTNRFVDNNVTKDDIETQEDLRGLSSSAAGSFANALFKGDTELTRKYGKFHKNMIPNNVLIFELDKSLSQSIYNFSQANDFVKRAYFEDAANGPNKYMDKIYMKFRVEVKAGVFEIIPCELPIAPNHSNILSGMSAYNDAYQSFGVMPVGSDGLYKYGYVVLEPSNNGKKEWSAGADREGIMMHPFQKYALGFVRQNLPDKIYGTCVSCDHELSIDNKVMFGNEMNKVMVKAGYLSNINDYDQTAIRLFEPDSIKYGGIARVKNLTYRDNWNAISGEFDSEYRWNYNYSEKLTSHTRESGVAAFEPNGISDENPLYSWVTYVDILKKFPDETKFHTAPLSRQLYPSSNIGYEEVEVAFEGSRDWGYSLTKFHTYRDKRYSTKEYSSTIQTLYNKSPKLAMLKLFWSDNYQGNAFSQGYLVETNNFHGQVNSVTLGSREKGSVTSYPISKTVYHYKGLKDEIPMIDREGNVTMEGAAIEYDVHHDSRFVTDISNMTMAGLGLSLELGSVPKISISPILPIFQNVEREFYSNCLIKHINYSAIVESIETTYLGSNNIAKNLLYDKYSGAVIVSSLKDEYNDVLYNVNYPSHWYESAFRQPPLHPVSIPCSGSIIPGLISVIGSSSDKVIDNFSVGDEVTYNGSTYFIYDIPTSSNSVKLMDATGNLANIQASSNLILVKSNRKNRLGESMQQVVTKTPLVITPGSVFTFPNNHIISSSAINYKYRNNFRCGLPSNPQVPTNEVIAGQIVNPFKYGVRNDLVLDAQYAWKGERSDGHAHGIRFDGTYETFEPFYAYDNTGSNPSTWRWKSLIDNMQGVNKWRKMGNINRFDEFGQVIEVQDQIKVQSSVLFGYSSGFSTLPVAQAVNAAQKDIAFDGFEDYQPMAAPIYITEPHFGFQDQLGANVSLTSADRHSGNYSLKIASGSVATVQREIEDDCFYPDLEEPQPLPTTLAVEECDCVPLFNPGPGEYIFSAWTKSSDVSNVFVSIHFEDGVNAPTSSIMLNPAGPAIDGWQKMEGSFIIPVPANWGNSNTIIVSLVNNSSDDLLVDDLRIHPFLAGMSTTVYDNKTFLPMATHDGYNFTTFYNYDENLNLVRVRVETIEGIKTISESEFNLVKN